MFIETLQDIDWTICSVCPKNSFTSSTQGLIRLISILTMKIANNIDMSWCIINLHLKKLSATRWNSKSDPTIGKKANNWKIWTSPYPICCVKSSYSVRYFFFIISSKNAQYTPKISLFGGKLWWFNYHFKSSVVLSTLC